MAVMGFDGAGIGGRRGARCLMVGLLVAAVAGVGGCTSGAETPDGTASPTSGATTGGPGPAAEAGVPILPGQPREEWRFTADELGEGAILASPTNLRP